MAKQTQNKFGAAEKFNNFRNDETESLENEAVLADKDDINKADDESLKNEAVLADKDDINKADDESLNNENVLVDNNNKSDDDDESLNNNTPTDNKTLSKGNEDINLQEAIDKMSDEKLLKLINEYKNKIDNKPKELGETRGRKGMKLRRKNMSLSDLNCDYIEYESHRRGMSYTQFVNMIIQKYRESPEGYID